MKTCDLFWTCLLSVSLSLCCISCSKDSEEPEVEPLQIGFFEIEKVDYKVSAEAQTFDVRVHTNVKASAKALEDASKWVSIGNSEQSGNYLVYQVNVKENTDSNKRTGNVVFTPIPVPGIMVGGLQIGSNTIVITQAGAEP